MKKKLCSRRGETIAEVLVAVLLVLLASAALAAMISAASRVNAGVKAKDDTLYSALTKVETGIDAVTNTGTVNVSGKTFSVNYRSDSKGTLYTYSLN